MKTTIFIVFVVLIVAFGGYRLARTFGYIPVEVRSSLPLPTSFIKLSAPTSVSYRIEEVARDLYVPWAIVFPSSDRIYVTERDGKIRAIVNGRLQQNPVHTISNVSTQSEEGLMGMTLDPDYNTNRYIYVCYAYEKTSAVLQDKVVRFTDRTNSFEEEQTIIDNIPAARFHAGCRIKFGPDKKLYITTGDATQKESAQDQNSLAGKILRLNADGSIPQDNPFPGSPIFSLGHRNLQGIDWHAETKDLWATEHGPSGNDGPGGGDEVNHIVAGKNYGWPVVSHEKTRPEFITPKLVFTPAIAPASGMFYSGTVFPQWKNNFFFGMLRGNGLMRVTLDESDPTKVLSYETVPEISFGRIREAAQSPDGVIYFSTSNADGRGVKRSGDDKVYRIVPAATQ